MANKRWQSRPTLYKTTPTGDVFLSVTIESDGRHGLILSKPQKGKTLSVEHVFEKGQRIPPRADMDTVVGPLMTKLEDYERSLAHPGADSN